jgi:hypothetical protein
LWLNKYHVEWPTSYVLKEPVALPAGTRLLVTTYYDNTTETALDARPALYVTGLKPRLGDATARQASPRPATLVP